MLLQSPPVRKGGHSMHRAVLLWAQPIHMMCLKSVSSLISEECPLWPVSAGREVWPSWATVKVLNAGSLVVLFTGSMAHRLMHEKRVIFDGSFSAPSIIYECCSLTIWWTKFDGHLAVLWFCSNSRCNFLCFHFSPLKLVWHCSFCFHRTLWNPPVKSIF